MYYFNILFYKCIIEIAKNFSNKNKITEIEKCLRKVCDPNNNDEKCTIDNTNLIVRNKLCLIYKNDLLNPDLPPNYFSRFSDGIST